MRQLKIKAYWWCEVPNFGDALAPFLLKRFADVETTWDTVSRASVVSIGSLLDHIPPLWDGYVLGSGKLYESSRLHLHTKTANILALRGPLSAAQSPPGDYAIGDPGLLAPELIPLPEKLYDLGILPHWSDHSLEHDPQFRSPKWSTMLIRPEWPPLEVVQRIGMCRKIVTSSLHGMVVADAYGIPRRFEYSPSLAREGVFKFLDYSRSIQTPFENGKLVEASRFRIEDRQHDIFDAYQAFGSEMRHQ